MSVASAPAVSRIERLFGRPPARVLTVRLGAVGDVLTTLPALAAVRRLLPDATVHHVVDELAAGVVQGLPCVDDVIVVPRVEIYEQLRRLRFGALGALSRRLRVADYELVIDFQGLARSAMLVVFSRAPLRIGRNRWQELNPLFFNFRISPSQRDNVVEQHLDLLRPLTPDGARPAAIRTPPAMDPVARGEAASELGAAGLSGPFVAVAPGSRWPARALPEALTAEIVRGLIDRGEQPLLVGGTAEEPSLRALGERFRVPLSTRLKLPALAALLARARAVICADSAPMHFADMLDVPVVALFGPSSPVLYGCRFSRHQHLRQGELGDHHDFRGEVGRQYFGDFRVETVLAALSSVTGA